MGRSIKYPKIYDDIFSIGSSMSVFYAHIMYIPDLDLSVSRSDVLQSVTSPETQYSVLKDNTVRRLTISTEY